MTHSLLHLLNTWHPQRDRHNWVLATVFKTEGPA